MDERMREGLQVEKMVMEGLLVRALEDNSTWPAQ